MTFLLATPAPPSEPVRDILPAPVPEPVSVEPAIPSAAPIVEPAPKVEPASCVSVDLKEISESGPLQSTFHVHHTGDNISFANYAAVTKVAQKSLLQIILPCLFEKRNVISYGEALRYVVVKGEKCLVYTDGAARSPIYTISLQSMTAVREDPRSPHKESMAVSPPPPSEVSHSTFVSVLLLDAKDDLSFQLIFNVRLNGAIVDEFISEVHRINSHLT